MNRKRIHRLWRAAGLRVPRKAPKRRRLGRPPDGENGTVRLAPAYPNHVWSYDFVFDQTEDGRPLKLMPILDEYTRECLALVVSRSITSGRVIAELDRLIAERGAPAFVRSDNGPEFVASVVKAHLAASGSEARFIDRGSSTPARRGRTRTWRAPTGSSATSCCRGRCSGAWPRPPCSARDTGGTTTRHGPTAR